MPAVVLAAPASGSGKTTLSTGLMGALRAAGRRVAPFKVGPDYIDPGYHAVAAGRPGRNLDPVMVGDKLIGPLFGHGARGADIAVIEGVMGLFDGEDCVADLAQRFGIPVLAVVDAGAMGGTLGAIVHGLRHYREGLPWAGVLANRVAGERHAGMLRAGLRDGADWLGALPRLSLDEDARAPLLPERHLGLVAANELPDALQRLDAAADALAATPLGRMDAQALQRFATDFPAPPPRESVAPLLAGRTVAVARDAAFCFIYPGNVQTLQQLGARVVFFSPLHDAALPACDAVWLPGGYPELHAAALAANTAFQARLRAHVQAGRPLWAECGGMMALCDAITLHDGRTVPLWGLLPGRVAMQRRLAALGPQQLALAQGCLRGHTFHYSTCDSTAPVDARTARPGQDAAPDAGEAVYRVGGLRASYFHAWFASSPRATAALFGAEGT